MVLALSKLQSKGKVYKWKDRIFFEELFHKVKVQGLEYSVNLTLRMIYFKEWEYNKHFLYPSPLHKKFDVWLSSQKLAIDNIHGLVQKDWKV